MDSENKEPTHAEIAAEAFRQFQDRIKLDGSYFGHADDDWFIAKNILARGQSE